MASLPRNQTIAPSRASRATHSSFIHLYTATVWDTLWRNKLTSSAESIESITVFQVNGRIPQTEGESQAPTGAARPHVFPFMESPKASQSRIPLFLMLIHVDPMNSWTQCRKKNIAQGLRSHQVSLASVSSQPRIPQAETMYQSRPWWRKRSNWKAAIMSKKIVVTI